MLSQAQNQQFVEQYEQEEQDQIFQKLAIYDTYVENNNKSESFFKQFFKDYQISRILVNKHFLKVQIQIRKKNKKQSKQKQQDSIVYSDSQPQQKFGQIKKTLQQGIQKLSNNFEHYDFKKKTGEVDYENFLKTKSGQQNFWIVQVSIFKSLLGFKKLVFSKKMIQMLGYQMEEAALYFRRYKQVAFNHISNKAYKQLILCLIKVYTQLSELDNQDLKNSQKMQQIFERNCVTVENQMIGKDNVIIWQIMLKY